MKYLVSGGAGFIGSNIVRRLLELDHDVTVLDNFSSGKVENLSEVQNDIHLIEGDIRDLGLVEKSLKGIDVVLHQAALPSVQRSIVDPLATNDVNINGTLNLLSASVRNGVQRFVYASSSSVYGDTPELPKHEGMQPSPLSPYAVSKLAAEKYCAVFSSVYGLHTVALRYFNVFGPRQDPASQYSAVIPKFITSIMRGVRPVIFGDGTQSRDFTFIDNVVDANILAATANDGAGMAMNCACHERIDLNELVTSINRLLYSDLKPVYDPPRKGDIKHSFASIDLISSKLNYRIKIGFEDGLERTVEWYVKNQIR